MFSPETLVPGVGIVRDSIIHAGLTMFWQNHKELAIALTIATLCRYEEV